MNQYKLIYFPVRGNGELIRQIFAAKEKLDVLKDENGHQLTQTYAIARCWPREFEMFVEYKENIYEDIEIESFVRALCQAGAIRDDECTWKEATTDKAYTPELFIKVAEYHRRKRDFIQCSCMYWLAASYTLKNYFRDLLRVQVNQHNAIRKLVNMVRNDETITPQRRKNIVVGWKAAEELHRYSYGDMRIDSFEFDQYVDSTKEFRNSFPKIKTNFIEKSIDKLKTQKKISGELTLIQGGGYYQAEIYYEKKN